MCMCLTQPVAVLHPFKAQSLQGKDMIITDNQWFGASYFSSNYSNDQLEALLALYSDSIFRHLRAGHDSVADKLETLGREA